MFQNSFTKSVVKLLSVFYIFSFCSHFGAKARVRDVNTSSTLRGRDVLNNESYFYTASLHSSALVERRPFCAAEQEGVNHFVIAAPAAPVP